MVRISKHKQAYKTELQEAKIVIPLNKYNFSQEFSDKLHEFSKDHHKDHFKVFNQALAEWTETNRNQIADEIRYIRKSGFDGKEEEIYQKIKISARFYYRK
jgi:predicted naringenin-chalcone synthase